MSNRILVSPIAFNENVKLKSVIDRFLTSRFYGQADYLVMDDCSDDGTSAIVAEYAAQGVKTIRHDQRSGVGASIRTVIQYAREHGYTILVIMAGNDKDNPEEISALVDPIVKEDYDFVQGSRYLKKDGVGGDMPFYRKIATRIHPLLMRVITGKKVTDTTNGFRAFKLSIFDDDRINIDQTWLNQYELEPYVLYKVLKCGYKCKEAPVTKIYPSRSLGYTKMKPLVGWWSILKPLIYLGLGIKK